MNKEDETNNLNSIFNDDKWTDFCQLYIEEMCKKRGYLHFDVEKLIQSRPSNQSLEKFGFINEIFNETIDDDSLAMELTYFVRCLQHFGCIVDETHKMDDKSVDIKTFESNYESAFNSSKQGAKACIISFVRQNARRRAKFNLRNLIFVCYELSKLGFGDVDFYNIPAKMMEEAENNNPLNRGAYGSDKFNKILEVVKNALNFDKEGIFDATMEENGVEYDESSRDLAESRGSSYTPNGLILRCVKLYSKYNLNDEMTIMSRKGIMTPFDEWMLNTIGKRFDIFDKEEKKKKLEEIKRITFNITVQEIKDKSGKINGFNMSMWFFVPNFQTFAHLFENYSLKQLCFMPPIEELYDLLSLFESANLSIDKKEQRIEINNAKMVFESPKTMKDLVNNPKAVRMVDLLLSLKELMLQTKIINQEIETSNWHDYLNFKLTGSSKLDSLVADKTEGETEPSLPPPSGSKEQQEPSKADVQKQKDEIADIGVLNLNGV